MTTVVDRTRSDLRQQPNHNCCPAAGIDTGGYWGSHCKKLYPQKIYNLRLPVCACTCNQSAASCCTALNKASELARTVVLVPCQEYSFCMYHVHKWRWWTMAAAAQAVHGGRMRGASADPMHTGYCCFWLIGNCIRPVAPIAQRYVEVAHIPPVEPLLGCLGSCGVVALFEPPCYRNCVSAARITEK